MRYFSVILRVSSVFSVFDYLNAYDSFTYPLVLLRSNKYDRLENMGAIKVAKLNPNFKYEIASQPGGEQIVRCFACGTCSASCLVREIDEQYNPRRIIRMAILADVPHGYLG